MMIDKQIEAAKREMIDYVDAVVRLHERAEHSIIDPSADKPYTPLDLMKDLQEALDILGVRKPGTFKSVHDIFQQDLIPALKEVESIISEMEDLLRTRGAT